MRSRLRTRPQRPAELPPVRDNLDVVRQWTTRLARARPREKLLVALVVVGLVFMWYAFLSSSTEDQYTLRPLGRRRALRP